MFQSLGIWGQVGCPQQRNGPRLAVVLAVLAVLPVLFLAPLFNIPMERDEGAYTVIASGWLDGAIPYRDLWDQKGPVTFLWYAGALRLFGETAMGPRILASLAAAASVPLVWGAGSALLDRRGASVAAILFATSFANAFLQANAHSETFMLLPLAAGFWAFTLGARGGNLLWFLVAGTLTVLAVLTKQTAGWMLLGYWVWLLLLAVRYRGERLRHLTGGALLGAGALLGVAPFALYFYWHDSLYDFWYATVAYQMDFTGQYPLLLKLVPPMIANPLPLFGGLALWFLAILGAVHLIRRPARLTSLIVLFLVASELAAQSVGKNSQHYSIQLLPAAAVAGAVGFEVVRQRWSDGDQKLGRALAICVVVSVVASLFVFAWPTSEERFLAQYGFRDYAYRSVDAREIAQEVSVLTDPSDYIYEFGRQSEIYVLADRRPATRWFHNRAVSIYPSIMDEIVRDLELRRPRLILLTFECQPPAREFADCENGPPAQLMAFLDEHYLYQGRVHYADFYERIQEPPRTQRRWP